MKTNDTATYPKTAAACTFMTETARKAAEAYEKQRKAYKKKDKIQRYTLVLQRQMAEHCASIPELPPDSSLWSEQIARREAILRDHPQILEPYETVLAGMDTDERCAFLLYAHTHWFLHSAIIDPQIEILDTAKAVGQPENAFDARITLSTAYSICREWRKWWQKNGFAPFDTWTYEDSPWETASYLPKDAMQYPFVSAARTFMVETARKAAADYEEQLAALSKEDKLQRKVLSIQKSMAENCASFAAMAFTKTTWPEQIARRETILRNHTQVLVPYADVLSEMTDEDEKFAFILYAHTNWFLHNAFLNKHLENLNAANAAGQPEKAFNDRIILGTVYAICRKWRTWWQENGSAPFDDWTYEDSPWENA